MACFRINETQIQCCNPVTDACFTSGKPPKSERFERDNSRDTMNSTINISILSTKNVAAVVGSIPVYVVLDALNRVLDGKGSQESSSTKKVEKEYKHRPVMHGR